MAARTGPPSVYAMPKMSWGSSCSCRTLSSPQGCFLPTKNCCTCQPSCRDSRGGIVQLCRLVLRRSRYLLGFISAGIHGGMLCVRSCTSKCPGKDTRKRTFIKTYLRTREEICRRQIVECGVPLSAPQCLGSLSVLRNFGLFSQDWNGTYQPKRAGSRRKCRHGVRSHQRGDRKTGKPLFGQDCIPVRAC